MTILADGKIGMGIVSPNQNLSINSTTEICGGNINKLLFSWDASNNYRHAIYANHDSSSSNNNRIDFCLWTFGPTAITIGDRRNNNR